VNWIAILTEALVAVLLAITIAYCMTLDRRLKALKGDRAALQSVIAELVTATGAAERAITTLREAVDECEHDLGAKLIRGGELGAELAERIGTGRQIVQQIGRITQAATPREAAAPEPAAPPARGRMAATVAQARALALRFEERARQNEAA
jgi:hypothetical protein